jgi:molybdenum cofactor cytidylyltransferase
VNIQNICAALLASGASKRFGSGNKLLAQLYGRPLVAHAATTLRALPFMHHVAICPPDELELHRLLAGHGFEIIINAAADEGLSASVRLAVDAAVSANANGLLIALADMPFVPPEHFSALSRCLKSQKSIVAVASNIEGTNASLPPACFDQTQFETLLESSGDAGARHLTAQAKWISSTAHFLKDFDRTSDFLPQSS